MKYKDPAIAAFAMLLILATPAMTQPAPTPSVTASPALSKQQQGDVEKLVDERFEKSAKVGDRIQTIVNTNVGWAIALLTTLIAVLGALPIIIGVFVLLLRGSVIQQIVSETRKHGNAMSLQNLQFTGYLIHDPKRQNSADWSQMSVIAWDRKRNSRILRLSVAHTT